MKPQLISIISLAAFLLFISGCKKLTETDFDLTYDATFTVQPTTNTAYQVFDQKVITTDIESKVKDAGGSMDKIQSITLSSFSAEISTPSTANFGTFESGEAWIACAGLTDQKIASITIAAGSTDRLLNYKLDYTDLTSYLKQTQFTLIAKGKLRYEVTTPIVLNGKVKASVKVKLL